MSKNKVTAIPKKAQFEKKMNELYGENSKRLLSCHYQPVPKTFRVNTLLASKKEVLNSLKLEGFHVEATEIPLAYVCINDSQEKRLAESKVYIEHKIYIQELASMLPALALEIQNSNVTILDLCAAPGSKTSQLAALTQNNGEITAVEKSRGRFFTLNKLVQEYGCNNVQTINADANRVVYQYPEFENHFDYVLVDVPCTNEGSLDFSDPNAFATWHEREPKRLAKLQRGILNSGLKMLKQGGVLVYSTCTYSVEENEAVVNWALKKWKQEIQLTSIKVPASNIQHGRVEWKGKEFDTSLKKTVRVLPNEYFNGFYLARFKKM